MNWKKKCKAASIKMGRLSAEWPRGCRRGEGSQRGHWRDGRTSAQRVYDALCEEGRCVGTGLRDPTGRVKYINSQWTFVFRRTGRKPAPSKLPDELAEQNCLSLRFYSLYGTQWHYGKIQVQGKLTHVSKYQAPTVSALR